MKRVIVLLGVLGCSFSAIFVRYASAPSMVLVFYRVLFASLLLLPLAVKSCREELAGLDRRALALPMASGAFLALHFTTYFESLNRTSIAASLALVDTEVFFIALITLLVLRERLSKKAWTGIGITFVGSLLVAMGDMGAGGNNLSGDLLALAGAFFVACYTMIGAQCRKRISTTLYTLVVYLSAAVVTGLVLLAARVPLTGYTPRDYLCALGLAAVCTLGGHSVFSWALKDVPAAFVSTAKLMEPVFATCLGLLLFGEVPAPLVVAGGVVVILGVFYYLRQEQAAAQKASQPG